ncbi:MAG: type IV secretory system conjugative DNA transfer family protein, partial [Lachnospiraceae bacterium]|nr:type IV secretory system conjugative DNA transfer family protein [Lachnospiraceae bacterium]
QQLANTFSYTLYHSKPATDDYWPDQATAMCNALIMAMVQDCIEADKVFNRRRKAAYDEKRKNFDRLSEDTKQVGRDNYSACLKELTQKNAHPDELFLLDDLVFIPPEVEYYPSEKNEQCINIYSLKNIVTELQMEPAKNGNTDITALDEFFMKRPAGDIAKLEYASIGGAPQQTKACIYSSFMKGINIISQANMARLTAENSINLLDVGYGEKPIAISVVIPDDDKSRWFMATIFVSQLYFVLSRETRKNPKGRTDRPVRFILDEFGNLPAFEAMDSYLSVCLGKNMSFDLYIQDYQQLDARYQKNSSTIKNNCGNKIWILSNDNNGAKEFSEMLGMTKRVQVERSGTAFSTNKTFTERPVEEPLMKPFQLMHLLPGEVVINRSSKREDLQHAPSVSYPIFNSYEMGMALKYRYQYLHDYFPNADEVKLEDITTDSREHIKYLERVWDYEGTQVLANAGDEGTVKVLRECKNYASIKGHLRRMYGVNYIDQTGYGDDYPVDQLIWNLKNDSLHDPALVDMLINMLNE